MTHAHEPVYVRFRGHMRRLPLVSLATALRRDLEGAANALEILLVGPPERVDSAAPQSPTLIRVSVSPRGEGDIGGGVHEQTPQQTTLSLSCEQEHEQRDGGAGEGARTAHLVAALGGDANRVALERLAAAHPPSLLDEALRRTLRIPPERIRMSRSAIFTGIVRKLAAEARDSNH